MKQLKSIGTSIGGFILIVVVYLVVNMITVDDASTEEVEQPSTVIELVERPETLSETERVEDSAEKDDGIHEVVVDRVVDGDTIVVDMYGELVKVRFSGVNTPESVGDYKDNPQFYGKEASAYTKSQLKEGQIIYLEEDVKALDKYDRYLAYIWLAYPSEEGFLTECFNAMLIEQGYAKWFDDYENKKYAKVFEALQKDAKKQNLGMWQEH